MNKNQQAAFIVGGALALGGAAYLLMRKKDPKKDDSIISSPPVAERDPTRSVTIRPPPVLRIPAPPSPVAAALLPHIREGLMRPITVNAPSTPIFEDNPWIAESSSQQPASGDYVATGLVFGNRYWITIPGQDPSYMRNWIQEAGFEIIPTNVLEPNHFPSADQYGQGARFDTIYKGFTGALRMRYPFAIWRHV